MKNADANYKTEHSRVDELREKVTDEFLKFLQKSEISDTEVESMESVSINKLIAELDAQEMMINTAESKLQKQYNEAPDPQMYLSAVLTKPMRT